MPLFAHATSYTHHPTFQQWIDALTTCFTVQIRDVRTDTEWDQYGVFGSNTSVQGAPAHHVTMTLVITGVTVHWNETALAVANQCPQGCQVSTEAVYNSLSTVQITEKTYGVSQIQQWIDMEAISGPIFAPNRNLIGAAPRPMSPSEPSNTVQAPDVPPDAEEALDGDTGPHPAHLPNPRKRTKRLTRKLTRNYDPEEED